MPRRIGLALILLAIAFNLPFARLAGSFNYPDILREPPQIILAAFTVGGTPLILTWYAFALSAMAFIPVGMAHALTANRATRFPALAISAAIAAALSGLLQAMGLLRWVLVVPGLAASGDIAGFALIHAYAGVGLGEHLGQILTAFHVVLVTLIQRIEGHRVLPLIGAATAIPITIGAMEGVVLATGADGSVFALSSITGYLMLTLWLIGSGIDLIRQPSRIDVAAAPA